MPARKSAVPTWTRCLAIYGTDPFGYRESGIWRIYLEEYDAITITTATPIIGQILLFRRRGEILSVFLR